MKQCNVVLCLAVACTACAGTSANPVPSQAPTPAAAPPLNLAAASPASPAVAVERHASSGNSLPLGAAMPATDVEMRSVTGTQVSLSSAAGERGTLVVFTANHCPWAQAWEARITALGNQYAAQGVGVIAINSNDPAKYTRQLFERMQPKAKAKGVGLQFSPDTYEEMQRRATEAGMRFPYAVDATSGIARAFGATRTPEVFLFNAATRLVYRGAVDDNAFAVDAVKDAYLADALRSLVAGEDMARAETRAVGCAIAIRRGG